MEYFVGAIRNVGLAAYFHVSRLCYLGVLGVKLLAIESLAFLPAFLLVILNILQFSTGVILFAHVSVWLVFLALFFFKRYPFVTKSINCLVGIMIPLVFLGVNSNNFLLSKIDSVSLVFSASFSQAMICYYRYSRWSVETIRFIIGVIISTMAFCSFVTSQALLVVAGVGTICLIFLHLSFGGDDKSWIKK